MILSALISRKISFTQSQVGESQELLDRFGYKESNINIIKEMISSRLPMVESIFLALSATREENLTMKLNDLLFTLKQSSSLNTLEQQLLKQLESLLVRPSHNQSIPLQLNNHVNFIHKLTSLLHNSNSRFVEVFNATKTLSPEVNSIRDFLLHNHQFQKLLSALTKHEPTLQPTAQQILKTFPSIQTGSLSKEQFTLLKNTLVEQLFLQLPTTFKPIVSNVLQSNSPDNQLFIHKLLQFLSNQDTYRLTNDILTTTIVKSSLANSSLQAQFLTHIQQFFETIGLKEEFVLKNNLVHSHASIQDNNFQTIKSLLIGLVQEDPLHANGKSQALLHYINGM